MQNAKMLIDRSTVPLPRFWNTVSSHEDNGYLLTLILSPPMERQDTVTSAPLQQPLRQYYCPF